MTIEDALFFAELWLSDKCNQCDKTFYQFMLIVYEVLKKYNEEGE